MGDETFHPNQDPKSVLVHVHRVANLLALTDPKLFLQGGTACCTLALLKFTSRKTAIHCWMFLQGALEQHIAGRNSVMPRVFHDLPLGKCVMPTYLSCSVLSRH